MAGPIGRKGTRKINTLTEGGSPPGGMFGMGDPYAEDRQFNEETMRQVENVQYNKRVLDLNIGPSRDFEYDDRGFRRYRRRGLTATRGV